MYYALGIYIDNSPTYLLTYLLTYFTYLLTLLACFICAVSHTAHAPNERFSPSQILSRNPASRIPECFCATQAKVPR